VLALLSIAPAAAQDKPVFTGQWVLVRLEGPAGEVAQALTVHESIVHASARDTRNARSLKRLRVERQFESGARSESYDIGLIGGSVAGLVPGAGQQNDPRQSQTRHSTQWDGNRLVIKTGSYSGPTRDSGPYREHKEVWWLDEQGRLVITMTDRGSDVPPETRTATYRKR
jgi:hypothetical protein